MMREDIVGRSFAHLNVTKATISAQLPRRVGEDCYLSAMDGFRELLRTSTCTPVDCCP